IHEAGHATLSWFLEYANPLVKVTIVPRGKALGAAWYLPEERQITTREQMLDQMCATLGGRAAEDVCIGRVSSGAMNDLERTTKQAYGMVAYLGLSEKLPNLCYYNAQDEFAFNKPYSEKTAELIDEEVKSLINDQYERAKEMLVKHRECHKQLADLLVEREVIYAEDLERLFGKRQWASRTEEIISLNEENLREINEEKKKANENQSEENTESNSEDAQSQSKTSNQTDH
ncbi:MAG: cell division protein FtsH, partial [Bacteroidales bacterium]|nr:cell division protein FtsH [Bacteroidales bacterium]